MTVELAVADRQRLLALRLLMLEAQARATDPTLVGRHLSVLLLDGCCERAMEMSARHLGVQKRQANFHRLYETLVSTLASWRPTGWKGVSDLHESRNHVQHSGIPVDRDLIPMWATDADRFIRGLIAEAFRVELSAVTLAEAVEDSGLRAHFAGAEGRLVDGDWTGCASASLAGLEDARRRLVSVIPRAPFTPTSTGFTDLDRFVAGAVEPSADLAEIMPFAPDVGEYLWLRKLGEVLAARGPATADEAQRALVFCLGWVLRYEAFHRRYGPRAHEVFAVHEIPTGPGGAPSISDLTVQPTYDGHEVRIQLVDAPNECTPAEYLDAVRAALHDELGTPVHYSRDGTIGLPYDPDTFNADALVTSATRAMAQATRKIAADRAESHAWNEQAGQVAAAHAAALADVRCDGAPVVLGVRFERDPMVSRDGAGPLIVVELDTDLIGINVLHEETSRPRDPAVSIVFTSGGVGLDPSDATLAWFRACLEATVSRVVEERHRAAEEEVRAREVAETATIELRDALARSRAAAGAD